MDILTAPPGLDSTAAFGGGVLRRAVWSTVKLAIIAWVAACTGIPESSIHWGKLPDGAWDRGPTVQLTRYGETTLGTDGTRYRYDPTRGAGAEMEPTTVGQRTWMLSVQVRTLDNEHDQDAWFYLDELRSALRSPESLAMLRAAGLGLRDMGAPVDLSRTENGRTRSRVQADIGFNTAANRVSKAQVTYIEAVTLDVCLVDPADQVVVEQVFNAGAFSLLAPAGLDSTAEFGAAAFVDLGGADLYGVGVPPSDAYGSPVLVLQLQGAGVPSEAVVPAAGLVAVLQAPGLPSTAAEGAPDLVAVLAGAGLGSSEAFGAPDMVAILDGAGVPPSDAYGGGTLADAEGTLIGVGIPPSDAYGSPGLVAVLDGVGLPSTEAFGGGTLADASDTLIGVGIPPSDAYGSPVMVAVLDGAGVAPSDAYGAPGLVSVLGGAGVGSSDAYGAPELVAVLAGAGVAPSDAVGSPNMTAVLGGAGVAPSAAEGAGTLVTLLQGAGVASSAAFGAGHMVAVMDGVGLPSTAAFGGGTLSAPSSVTAAWPLSEGTGNTAADSIGSLDFDLTAALADGVSWGSDAAGSGLTYTEANATAVAQTVDSTAIDWADETQFSIRVYQNASAAGDGSDRILSLLGNAGGALSYTVGATGELTILGESEIGGSYDDGGYKTWNTPGLEDTAAVLEIVFDSNAVAASDRLKVYVDGSDLGAPDSETWTIGSGAGLKKNTPRTLEIGGTYSQPVFLGYLSIQMGSTPSTAEISSAATALASDHDTDP